MHDNVDIHITCDARCLNSPLLCVCFGWGGGNQRIIRNNLSTRHKGKGKVCIHVTVSNPCGITLNILLSMMG